MRILAHRGHHRIHPENSLESFRAAVELGVDGIETDLRLAGDGQIVLYHDRLTPDGQKICDLSQGDLSRAAKLHVPTLEEGLDAAPDTYWALEIKTPEVVPNLLATLKSRPNLRGIVISFRHDTIAELRGRCPLPLGMTLGHRPTHFDRFLDCGVQTLIWGIEFLEAAAVDEVRRGGLESFVYDVKIPEDHAFCAGCGVDVIISDCPDAPASF